MEEEEEDQNEGTQEVDESAEADTEAGGDEAAEAASVPSGIDLMGEDVPEWLRGQFDARGDKLPNLTADELEALPMEAKFALNRLRKQHEAFVEAQTGERAELAKLRAELEDKILATNADRAQMASFFGTDEFKKLLAGPEGDAPDPYSEAGIQYQIQKLVNERLAKVFGAMEARGSELQAQVEEAETARKVEARKAELLKFRDEHPDFDEHTEEMKTLVKEFGIPAERAYLLVKAEKGLIDGDTRRLSNIERSRARAQGASRPGGGRPSKPSVRSLKGMSAMDRAQFLAENPELQKLILREMGAGS